MAAWSFDNRMGIVVLLRQLFLLFVPFLLAWLAWAGRPRLKLAHLAPVVLDTSDGPVILVGCSMGGYAAFAFARKHPSLLRALVLADDVPHPLGSPAVPGEDGLKLSHHPGLLEGSEGHGGFRRSHDLGDARREIEPEGGLVPFAVDQAIDAVGR